MNSKADDSIRDLIRETIIDLIRCRPDDWPEILAAQAGAACGMNIPALNLLADASVQVAATAHRLAMEGHEE